MTIYQGILSGIGILMLPMLGLLVKVVGKWTKVEERLARVVDELSKLNIDRKETHAAILATQAEDRRATNERLQKIEEHFWRASRKDAA